jgi:hypothetical protein
MLSWIFIVLAHWNNSPRVAPLGHIIPIPDSWKIALALNNNHSLLCATSVKSPKHLLYLCQNLKQYFIFVGLSVCSFRQAKSWYLFFPAVYVHCHCCFFGTIKQVLWLSMCTFPIFLHKDAWLRSYLCLTFMKTTTEDFQRIYRLSHNCVEELCHILSACPEMQVRSPEFGGPERVS